MAIGLSYRSMIQPRRRDRDELDAVTLAQELDISHSGRLPSQPSRRPVIHRRLPGAAERISIRLEKVIDWWTVVIRIGFSRPSLHHFGSSRDHPGITGKAQIDMRSCGSIITNGMSAPLEHPTLRLKPGVKSDQLEFLHNIHSIQ